MNQEAILRFIQSFSTPFFDTFFSLVTMFGEQYFLIFIICLIYWNISKKDGFILSFSYLFSLLINDILKILIRSERPFMKVENIEGKRIHTATGYSFPSGHTQGATSFFTTLLLIIKKKWFTILAIILSFFVAFSRMYLGVHWPIDVIVALILGFVISFFIYKYLNKIYYNRKKLYRFLIYLNIILIIIGIFFVLIKFFIFEGNLFITNYMKIIGTTVGALGGFILEEEKIPFSNKASTIIKAIRFVFGIISVMIILLGLKFLFPENFGFDFVRYLLTGFWITAGFPFLGLKIKLFNKQIKIIQL